MAEDRLQGFNAHGLREEMKSMFDRVAREPKGNFHFNRGMRFAARLLNYSESELGRVPRACLARFTGVGNPHRLGRIRPGESVMDHSCGSGTDLIIAAHKTGPSGRVIGVDISDAMLDVAWEGCRIAGVDAWTSLFNSGNDVLPVDDRSIDVVISNGALNRAINKVALFSELFRTLRPGGRLHLSAVVLTDALPAAVRDDPKNWASGFGGALPEPDLLAMTKEAGFVAAALTERFDCFQGSGVEISMPPGIAASAVNLYARKPLQGR